MKLVVVRTGLIQHRTEAWIWTLVTDALADPNKRWPVQLPQNITKLT